MIERLLYNREWKVVPKWIVLSFDMVIITICFISAYLIRFNLSLDFDVDMLWKQIPLVWATFLIGFLVSGSYNGVVRHTGIKDIYRLFNAICIASIILIISVIVIKKTWLPSFAVPLSIIIINSLLAFISLTATRYVIKSIFEYLVSYKTGAVKNVIIYGAGESGILTYHTLTSHSQMQVRVVGYVDDDPKKIGKHINGVRVFRKEALNVDFISIHGITEIIFCIQRIEPSELRKLVDELVPLPVKVKIVPPIEDWINGKLKLSQIKQVQIEDLLNRPPIQIQNSKVKKDFENQTIMVTGAAGSIGSELVRQISNYDYDKLILIDQAESALYDIQQELKQSGKHNFVPIVADIRDKNNIKRIISVYRPTRFFHAAAYKHVPLMEANPYEAIRINVIGTKNLVDICMDLGVDKFVFVSTDKAVNPTNVMGATKRIAEMYISCRQQEGKTKLITTRFGNVLGSNGSVIPLFKRQIEKGGPLTVTHKDITRYFMTIPEASQLVLEAGAMGKGGEIFIFDMGESVKIFDLAKNMIRLSGLKYPDDIDIKITGLRPGEKLYEELLANGENTLPTYHKKIMISKVRDLEYAKIRSAIDELCLNNMFYKEEIVPLMKIIVPEYKSNNSYFCKYDEKKSEVVDKNEQPNKVLN